MTRYFDAPFPEAVESLRQALYPRLLPRNWARDSYEESSGAEAESPDTLDEWVEICHRAGQTRPTQILLRYGATGDWNALHRVLYGDMVFPLQVVINLNDARRRPHRRRVPPGRTATEGPVPRYVDPDPARPRPGLHHPRPPGQVRPRLVRPSPVRHGVSTIHSGHRHTLGLVFHDAK